MDKRRTPTSPLGIATEIGPPSELARSAELLGPPPTTISRSPPATLSSLKRSLELKAPSPLKKSSEISNDEPTGMTRVSSDGFSHSPAVLHYPPKRKHVGGEFLNVPGTVLGGSIELSKSTSLPNFNPQHPPHAPTSSNIRIAHTPGSASTTTSGSSSESSSSQSTVRFPDIDVFEEDNVQDDYGNDDKDIHMVNFTSIRFSLTKTQRPTLTWNEGESRVENLRKNLFPTSVFGSTDRKTGEVLRSLAEHLFIGQGIAIITGLAALLMVYGISKVDFLAEHPTPELYFDKKAFTTITTLFMVLGIACFAFLQALSLQIQVIKSKYYVFALVALFAYIAFPQIMERTDSPYWYYYGDTLLLVVVYVVLCFGLGYSLFPRKPRSEKISDGIWYMLTEGCVALMALIYGMIVLLQYGQLSAGNKVIWRTVIHIAYFEVFMNIPVRFLVIHHMKKQIIKKDDSDTTKSIFFNCNILYCLTVVHAQSHIATLGKLMLSSFDSISFLVISIIILNVGKLIGRCTTPLRDMLLVIIVGKARKIQETVDRDEHLIVSSYVSAASIHTDIIMDNAASILSAMMMYFFNANRPLFMFPYPAEAHFTLELALTITFIQFAFGLVFDALSLLCGHFLLRLPIIETWEAMWQKKWQFFGFLAYGFMTMGVLGVIYMVIKVPRGVPCTSPSACDCMWVGNCENYMKTVAAL